MQNLSDKELDELFKNKFEDAAVAPPALLWPAIEKEIKPHSKPRLRIYRLAAAVAIVALVAGWLFTKEEKTELLKEKNMVKGWFSSQKVEIDFSE